MRTGKSLMSIHFSYIGRAVRPVDITVTQDEHDGSSSRACREATGEFYYAGSWRTADKGSADVLIADRVEFERLGLRPSNGRSRRRFRLKPPMLRR